VAREKKVTRVSNQAILAVVKARVVDQKNRRNPSSLRSPAQAREKVVGFGGVETTLN